MGSPNSENAEQTLTVKRIGRKLKTIKTNFKKSVDTSEKLFGGSPAVTSIENSIDTYSSTKESTESTENNDIKNMAPSSDEGTGYALESGSNFEENN